MSIRMVGIIVLHGKAYIPSLAETTSGLFIQINPIFEVDIEEDKLADVIEKVSLSPRPRVPDLTREEWKKRKDPVLTATKAKSWKELAQKGASFGLEWTDQGIRLDIPRLDQEGRWEIDPSAVTLFPLNTPLKEIAKVIIQNIDTRPDLKI